MKIAGVVVLYHPGAEVVQNILSYLDHVSELIIVDNSPVVLDDYTLTQLNVCHVIHYVHRPQNIGVAAALNIGANIAISAECSYLLTMDQDSRFREGDCAKFLEACGSLCTDRLGIAVPCHSSEANRNDVHAKPRRVTMAMTSGNLLNLRAYQDCGAFDENLFIDHVDHEYCLRLNSRQWEVWEIPSIVLEHELGKMKDVTLFRKRVRQIVSHAPQRDYYVVRNGLMILRKYRGQKGIKHIKCCLRDVIIKAVFCETDRLQRLGWLIRAVKDYHLNRMGKVG